MSKFLNFKEVSEIMIDERKARNIDNICKYGIQILDEYLWGILENELVVIWAGSWVWKTELAWQVAITNAMRWKKVALLSLEWDVGEISYRYFQREINKKRKKDFLWWPEYRLNLTNVEKEEQKVLKEIPKELIENLKIFDKSFIPDREKLLRLLEEECDNVDMFVIDHLHYLDYGADERNGITEIVRWIKEMTEIIKVPVVLISHLRRDFDKNWKLPTKSDLHWSSNIEKNANTVILIASNTENEELIEFDNPWQSAYLRWTRLVVDKNRTWMPVPAIFDATFDIRTKEYLVWPKHQYISPDEKNKITSFDKIFT